MYHKIRGIYKKCPLMVHINCGFQEHGPYPGLPGIGHSTYVNNGNGSIGSRSGLMDNDIGSNGTLGCIGVELGGYQERKLNKSSYKHTNK